MLIAALVMLGACGIIMFQSCQDEPPDIIDAAYIVNVLDSQGNIVSEYLTSDYEYNGEDCILNSYYRWNGSKWKYHDDRPLRITPKWGEVKISRRR